MNYFNWLKQIIQVNDLLGSLIVAGAVALVYGRSAKRMPVAQNALKHLGLDQGAHEMIWLALKHRLAEDLPETTERFLSLLTTN